MSKDVTLTKDDIEELSPEDLAAIKAEAKRRELESTRLLFIRDISKMRQDIHLILVDLRKANVMAKDGFFTDLGRKASAVQKALNELRESAK